MSSDVHFDEGPGPHECSFCCIPINMGPQEKRIPIWNCHPMIIKFFKASSFDESPRVLGAVTTGEKLHDRMHQSLADVSPTVVVIISDMLHKVVLSILKTNRLIQFKPS